MSERRRGALSAALAAVVVLAAVGCTPRQNVEFGSTVGVHDLTDVGRVYQRRIMSEFGGAYDDPPLQAYVNEIMERLYANQSRAVETPEVVILNSPAVSLMSTPNGKIFITRGLLAVANNEAELAGLLAMEAVNYQSYRRDRFGMRRDFGASVMREVPRGSDIASLIQYVDAPYLRPYTANEVEVADEEAAELLMEAGYDPTALLTLARTLDADSRLMARMVTKTGGPDPYHFNHMHPRSAFTVEQVLREFDEIPVTATELNRPTYLDLVNQMSMDHDLAFGLVEGGNYVSPFAGFRFTPPPNFEVVPGDGVVVGRGPNDSTMVFDVTTSPKIFNLMIYLRDDLGRSLPMRDLEFIRVNGLSGASGRATVSTEAGPVDFRLAVLRIGGDRLARFLFVLPRNMTDSLSLELSRAVQSFERLNPADAGIYFPHRLRVVQAGVGDSIESLADSMPYGNRNRERFIVLNGLQAGAQVQPGEQVKIVETADSTAR